MPQARPSFAEEHLQTANERRERIQKLEDGITELSAHIHAATYRLLEMIREYDECKGWSQPGLRSCAHWLNWKCGIGLGAAREKVRVAHALKELPQIREAFRHGRVSFSKVRAMTRVATPENEDYLLMIARHGTASHVERLVRHYRRVKRTEALSEENRRHEVRELMLYPAEDGSFIIKGRLTPEAGALLKKALESGMDEAFEERKNVSAETSGEAGPSPKFAARRADALVRMAEAYLAGSSKHSEGGDRYLVHVHTDVETLKENGDGAEAEVEDCGCVSAETARRMACDTGMVHWLENAEGEPLNIGRKTRTVPPAIRRALKRRDGGCRFPGCSCIRFVDAHHIQHWADGGETSMDNLVLLCRHHHRLVHEGGFTVENTSNKQICFRDAEGKVIPTNGEKRFRGNVFSLRTGHAKVGIRITPKTGISLWRGEQMDDQMAVEALLRRDRYQPGVEVAAKSLSGLKSRTKSSNLTRGS